LTLRNVRGGSGFCNNAPAIAADTRAEWLKSNVRENWSETARPGTPSSAPSSAPDTVSEYVTSSPRFQPLLIPETRDPR
jgi:hypothetical protein